MLLPLDKSTARVNKKSSLRVIMVTNTILSFFLVGQELQIKTIIPVLAIPTSYPVLIQPFSALGEHYLAVVNSKEDNKNYDTASEIYKINSTEHLQLVQRFYTKGGRDFEFADLKSGKYAIFAEHFEKNVQHQRCMIYQFMPNSDKTFMHKQSMQTMDVTKVRAFVQNNEEYLVVANSKELTAKGLIMNVPSALYIKEDHGYGKSHFEFETKSAHDVEVFKIDGIRYLAFANYMDNMGEVDIYSSIYR